jgi:hypothetical protein
MLMNFSCLYQTGFEVELANRRHSFFYTYGSFFPGTNQGGWGFIIMMVMVMYEVLGMGK